LNILKYTFRRSWLLQRLMTIVVDQNIHVPINFGLHLHFYKRSLSWHFASAIKIFIHH